ncbi:MAG: transcriptional regulator [Proteobacteria bacterium]|nr:transcriptional regulator [Pseudomonadota bacterium]
MNAGIEKNQSPATEMQEMNEGQAGKTPIAGTQTLLRGLTLLELVAEGTSDVKSIAAHLGTPRSTTHRMLNSLVNEGYLHHIPYRGYLLGPKLIQLGMTALAQRPLVPIARPHLEALAASTGDTVHLGQEDGDYVLYLDKIAGTRGLEMRSQIGQRKPIASTGVGKALMLGISPERWQHLYQAAWADQQQKGASPMLPPWPQYRDALYAYVQQGWVYDLEEHELGIRCIGSAIRDVSGKVVASVSVASAVPYMTEERMSQLGPVVLETARAISRDLGWKDAITRSL